MRKRFLPNKIPQHFYQGNEVCCIAKELLGKILCTNIDGQYSAGMIVETEAYNGVQDKASHAYGARRSQRTATMYSEGGCAYVYLCYGIHSLFNVVVGEEDNPLAVLIRGLEPVSGIELMLQRRKMSLVMPKISGGPGLLSQALGIDRKLNGVDLQGDEIWIEDSGIQIPEEQIVTTTRIGVDYAAEGALLPYRFYVKGNPFVSRQIK